jgi:hypothetical protein
VPDARDGRRADDPAMLPAPALLPLTTALATAGLPATAHAAAAVGPVDYTVVRATHASTVTRADDGYQGRSTATWSLRRPARFRMTWMAGGLFSGTGRLDVRGRYAIDATTTVPGHCAFEAPTGDREHPLVAPAPFDLTVTPDARRPGRALVGFVAVQATLKNPYLATECASGADEPAWPEMQTLDLAPSRLRAKAITLRFAGTRTAAGGLTYTYRTTIVLKRRG